MDRRRPGLARGWLVAAGLGIQLASLGCASFYDEIFLEADGSGIYRLTVISSEVKGLENLVELRSLIEDRARRIAQATGLKLRSLDVRREEKCVVIEAAADFPSLAVFAHPAFSVSDDAKTWAFVVPREATYQEGRFVARLLRGTAPARESPIRAWLKGREARFSVHLPAQIRASNGLSQGNTATWVFGLESLCDRPLELVAEAKPSGLGVTLGLGFLILVALGILVASILRKPQRPQPKGV